MNKYKNGANDTTCMISVISMMKIVGRHRALLVALSLVALASFGCSKEPPPKDQILSRAHEALPPTNSTRPRRTIVRCSG